MDRNNETIDPQLEIAKALIMSFIAEVNDDELRSLDDEELGHIPIAYTTTEDGDHEIEVEISLIDYSIDQYVDGELVSRVAYENLGELIEKELRFLDFDDLIYIKEML